MYFQKYNPEICFHLLVEQMLLHSDIRLRSTLTPDSIRSVPSPPSTVPFWGTFHMCLNFCKKPAHLLQSLRSSHNVQQNWNSFMKSIYVSAIFYSMYISPTPSLPWCEFSISFQGSQCMLEGFVFLRLWNKLCWFHGNALRLQTFLFLVWCLLLLHHTPGGLDHHHLCALCPSILLEDLKGKMLFKHSTQKCQKSLYVSGFRHDIISGLDAQYSTIQVDHAFATS